MILTYETYLDKVLGGWIGKSMGGAIGARFEGYKGWLEIKPEEMFPPTMPPNDDLDLQVLWLKVLEEKGAALTSDDLAAAWLEGCWYPFNEYGVFRRNWRLGLHPPVSGRYGNRFWETGMGCPIRSEIWGYVFPGAPDLAARYAEMDGTLDHTEQSVGAEKMLSAMAAMAFFVPDVRRLTSMFIHYLPAGSPIERLTRAAFQAHAEGLSLRDARDRLMALAGVPEACDAQINVPFTFLALLYGNNDLQETMLAALRCGYDTDCTLATAAALIGQILGASRIPDSLRKPVGDELVMGIEYRRPEMTISALARDTARIGVLLSSQASTGVSITGSPALKPLPATAVAPATTLAVAYAGQPCAAPGERVDLRVKVAGKIPAGAALAVAAPDGWTVTPARLALAPGQDSVDVSLRAPARPATWPMHQRFVARLEGGVPVEYAFGVVGTPLWQFLGAYYDALPAEGDTLQQQRRFHHHFVSMAHDYLPAELGEAEIASLYKAWSVKLGRPALIASRETEVDPGQLIGLQGPYCAYVARTVISPDDREVYLGIGNTDAYRITLNGTVVAEREETIAWCPFSNTHKVPLRRGPNRFVLKLLKRSDAFRFTFALRNAKGARVDHFNCTDWTIDLADAVPQA